MPYHPGQDPDNPGEDPDNPGQGSDDQNNNNNNNNSGNNNNNNSGNNNNSNNNNVSHLINTEKAEDNTTANSVIPQTGSNILFIILPIIAVAIIGSVAFIKLRKFKDIR